MPVALQVHPAVRWVHQNTPEGRDGCTTRGANHRVPRGMTQPRKAATLSLLSYELHTAPPRAHRPLLSLSIPGKEDPPSGRSEHTMYSLSLGPLVVHGGEGCA